MVVYNGTWSILCSSKHYGTWTPSSVTPTQLISIPLKAAHTGLFILFITEPTPHLLVSRHDTGTLAAGSCRVLLKVYEPSSPGSLNSVQNNVIRNDSNSNLEKCLLTTLTSLNGEAEGGSCRSVR
jgi:hypothetical protein